MTSFDSILNVDEWISDHYFTTDATKGESFTKRVKNRTKEWAATDSPDGAPLSPVKRLQQVRGDLQKSFATEASRGDHKESSETLIRTAFSYGEPSQLSYIRAGDSFEYQGWAGNAGTLVVLSTEPNDSDDADTAEDLTGLISAGGVKQIGKRNSSQSNEKDQAPTQTKIKDLIGDLFLSETPPDFIVVLAGAWVILAERESWPLGRYLAINLQLAVERNDTKKAGELERIAVILARENLERAADGTTWWADTIEESRQHAVKVSGDLRDAVRESIEIIGNDVLTRRLELGLENSAENIDGNELARQSLRYLYRILFLLFAEASPELAILPTGTPEYVDGYGLDRLRDRILEPPVTEKARRGTHLYDSLQLLFKQVNEGHDPSQTRNADLDAQNEGLTFRNLEADLFKHTATSLIEETKLSNEALTQVLQNLLLSKVSAGKDRGFISYATLGVTELGQVYEGLMSYHGFIAEEDLYEVAPNGDASKGSWVIPTHKADTVPEDSFVMQEKRMEEGGTSRVRREHPRGSFVFRQSSRDRERSASFYTPQVLTEFTVGQAIEVLQEEGRITKAEDVLSLTICEPAMGSGAFAVEAVRQLAELYLKLKEDELDTKVDPDQRTLEVQKIKAHIALHQVYGVDLNPTAVELAEISLWLETMTAELKAPWFGLHLRRGNSLIGALRSTYSTSLLNKKAWLTEVPRCEPLTNLKEAIDAGERDPLPMGRIHHFLLPSETWGAAANAEDLKALAADEQMALKNWRKKILVAPNNQQKKRLTNLAARVETLWAFALTRMNIAEEQIRRDIDLWGKESSPTSQVVTREEIERDLLDDEHGAYRRLRLTMDAWNTLTFWPLTAKTEPPTFDEWLDALSDILGVDTTVKDENQFTFGGAATWEDLNTSERTNLEFAGARSMDYIIEHHPWIETVQQISADQGFFHWDLDFATVFAKGGFDLQVGNPPWVRPRGDMDGLYSEMDPWFSLTHKPTQAAKNERRQQWNENDRMRDIVFKGAGDVVATAAVLRNEADFPHLVKQQPDLYRAFMERTWKNLRKNGTISLIHPKSHFTELKAKKLRRAAYYRLRRNWHFTNKLGLFDINKDEKNFDVAVYGTEKNQIGFLFCGSAHHPETVASSLSHDGTGPIPSFKTDDGKWDLRPHRDRIQYVELDTLRTWSEILEDEHAAVDETRTIYTVNIQVAKVLSKMVDLPRLNRYDLQFSRGWDESVDKAKGYFDAGWAHPDSWNDTILQGSHLGVSNPFNKQPLETLKKDDWIEVDLEGLQSDSVPVVGYKPNTSSSLYDEDYSRWLNRGSNVSSRSTFRIAWRQMAAPTGFRTLYPALIPPGAAHVNGIISAGLPQGEENLRQITMVGAGLSSLLADFFVRSIGSHLWPSLIQRIPFQIDQRNEDLLLRHYLRLNCLTEAYAPLWEGLTGEKWTVHTPLRKPEERRAAQIMIDAIVAVSIGVSADELCTIYRTQFPVMRGYDQKNRYDSNGRIVPMQILKADKATPSDRELPLAERSWIHPQSGIEYVYEYPFRQLDREADLRHAYQEVMNSLELSIVSQDQP